MSAKVVRQIGNFELVRELGRGAMGRVFLARWLRGDSVKVVALKVLHAAFTRDEAIVYRLRQESRAASVLKHDNIVQAIDFGAADGHVYFAMEYVKGKTLHEVLSRWGALAERPALRIARQIALALQHANRHKIVHRDIKPSNILVTKAGLAKLADFGLALDRSRARPGPKEKTFGTPWYMAPEQARGEEVDIRGDIYALGATLYRTLAGKPPNDGETLEEVLRHCLLDPAPDPRAIRPGISEPSARLVMAMMAKALPERVQTPEALIERIDSVLAALSPSSSEPLEALVEEPDGDPSASP